MKRFSLEEKFAQMILVGLDVYDINDEIIDLIKNYKIGGVVLYKKNYTSLETMLHFINKLKDLNKNNEYPLFIAIDQENGRVNRFPKDVIRLYSANHVALANDKNISDEVNMITTKILSSVGVNMNFAPVLDIVRNNKNKVIGNRSYGNNPKVVLENGISFMREMQKNNIISVVKHFPGHGLSNKDSHFSIPKIKDIDTLKKEDLNVFASSFKYGADAVMIDHLQVKGYGLKPTTINSKIISDLLIDKCKYNGLIVTDDLRMNFLKYFYGIKKCVKKSIEAGSNVLLIKYKKNDVKKVYKKLLKSVKCLDIDPEKIDKSYKKIISIKKKYNLTNELKELDINIDSVNKKIKEVNERIDNIVK